ncbi:MAG TPA: hypothetical protein IGS40_21595 [Trichormus sp. M33_DOE_039]|nr:hypothetical protein [Trichormus sp. M33_DOE_039]
MSLLVTDNLYDGVQKITPSATSSTIIALAACITFTPSYGSFNQNSFINNKTSSQSSQSLNVPLVIFSNSSTEQLIYKNTIASEEVVNEFNVQEVDESEDLLDWDIWIDNPPVVKTITARATLKKGKYLSPSISAEL